MTNNWPQEHFFDAVRADPDMTPEQKAYWLAKETAPKANLVCISIACNRPETGEFTGRFDALHVGMDALELRYAFWPPSHAPRCRVASRNRLGLSRALFPFHHSRDRYGNWCWNAYWATPEIAAQIVNYLGRMKHAGENDFHVEGGHEALYEKYQAGQEFTAADFADVK